MARILIIEDDPQSREMLAFRLRKAGYEIKEAIDGDDGLMRALRRPDLIIMDVRLPKIDGWQLCKTLKAEPRTKDIPIVMLTGCSQDCQEQYGRQCGADAYMTKPCDPKELLKQIQAILAKVPKHDPRP